MLTKYQLTNIPEGGVFHILPGRRRVRIVKEMSDEQADELISLGIGQYFLPIDYQSNVETQNSGSDTAGSAGDQPGTRSTADNSESGSVKASGSEPSEPVATDGSEPGEPVARYNGESAGSAAGDQPGAGSEGNSEDHDRNKPYVLSPDGIWTEQPETNSGSIAKRKSAHSKKA